MFVQSHLSSTSIQQLTFDAVMDTDMDLRREMLTNVVLAGGNTMFQGFADRFVSELAKLKVEYLEWA